MLSDHCDRRWIIQPQRSQLPRCIQSVGSRYSDQHLPEAEHVRRARSRCHFWWHRSSGREGWIRCYGYWRSSAAHGNYGEHAEDDGEDHICPSRTYEWWRQWRIMHGRQIWPMRWKWLWWLHGVRCWVNVYSTGWSILLAMYLDHDPAASTFFACVMA